MKPRRPAASFADKMRETQAALAGLEMMYGDLRQDKGQRELGRQEIAPKRTRAKPAVRTTPSEHQEQSVVIKWWGMMRKKHGLPKFALFAIPNGQVLMRSARNPHAVMAYLRAEGFRDGMLDLMLAVPRNGFHGCFMEMKVSNGAVSDEQTEVLDYMKAAGYKTAVCWSAEEAIIGITDYLA